MTNRQQDETSIADYASRVERHLVGPSSEKSRVKDELTAYLADASEADELTEAMNRLGSPKAAASSFARGRISVAAPLGRRLVAAAIDNLPLIGITIALLVQEVFQRPPIVAYFPPFIYAPGGGPLHAIGVPLALAWAILGLGILESQAGYTPGKALLRLRIVTDAGLRVSPLMGVVRRLSFLAGPFAWIDWGPPILAGWRHRILDYLVGTVVVKGARAEGPDVPQ